MASRLSSTDGNDWRWYACESLPSSLAVAARTETLQAGPFCFLGIGLGCLRGLGELLWRYECDTVWLEQELVELDWEIHIGVIRRIHAECQSVIELSSSAGAIESLFQAFRVQELFRLV